MCVKCSLKRAWFFNHFFWSLLFVAIGCSQIVAGVIFFINLPVLNGGSNMLVGLWTLMFGVGSAVYSCVGKGDPCTHRSLIVFTVLVVLANAVNLIILEVFEWHVLLSASTKLLIQNGDLDRTLLLARYVTGFVTILAILIGLIDTQIAFCIVYNDARRPLKKVKKESVDTEYVMAHRPKSDSEDNENLALFGNEYDQSWVFVSGANSKGTHPIEVTVLDETKPSLPEKTIVKIDADVRGTSPGQMDERRSAPQMTSFSRTPSPIGDDSSMTHQSTEKVLKSCLKKDTSYKVGGNLQVPTSYESPPPKPSSSDNPKTLPVHARETLTAKEKFLNMKLDQGKDQKDLTSMECITKWSTSTRTSKSPEPMEGTYKPISEDTLQQKVEPSAAREPERPRWRPTWKVDKPVEKVEKPVQKVDKLADKVDKPYEKLEKLVDKPMDKGGKLVTSEEPDVSLSFSKVAAKVTETAAKQEPALSKIAKLAKDMKSPVIEIREPSLSAPDKSAGRSTPSPDGTKSPRLRLTEESAPVLSKLVTKLCEGAKSPEKTMESVENFMEEVRKLEELEEYKSQYKAEDPVLSKWISKMETKVMEKRTHKEETVEKIITPSSTEEKSSQKITSKEEYKEETIEKKPEEQKISSSPVQKAPTTLPVFSKFVSKITKSMKSPEKDVATPSEERKDFGEKVAEKKYFGAKDLEKKVLDEKESPSKPPKLCSASTSTDCPEIHPEDTKFIEKKLQTITEKMLDGPGEEDGDKTQNLDGKKSKIVENISEVANADNIKKLGESPSENLTDIILPPPPTSSETSPADEPEPLPPPPDDFPPPPLSCSGSSEEGSSDSQKAPPKVKPMVFPHRKAAKEPAEEPKIVSNIPKPPLSSEELESILRTLPDPEPELDFSLPPAPKRFANEQSFDEMDISDGENSESSDPTVRETAAKSDHGGSTSEISDAAEQDDEGDTGDDGDSDIGA